MKVLICACLFAVACKGESAKPAPAETKPTTTTTAPSARPRPTLPEADNADGRERPKLPDGIRRTEQRDLSDPAVRAEMEQRREEMRKRREERLDTNKDGVVSDEERKQRLKPMIDRFDQNSDGKLTPDELAASDRRMGFDDPAAVDTDKNGEISIDELDTAVKARREQMRTRWRDRRGGSGDRPD